ncbi:hypothetical protein Y032_0997g3342 [Ancylostoma ceylanicum]|uniref:CWH43-like N-terminal domain-containing protein n=1 Tax=Ancylostoma ceylanicum TaxID=53326 RepID=A0A016W7Y3_9BILA|nr:hypothetical protein Y032_0997g3342 [Ancylostoma ceylanicum]
MLQCGVLGAAHLPILFGVLFSINLGTTYILAVVKSDVEPIFPYVSAAGDHRPESCVFGLLLNLSSVVSLAIIYLRYSLVTVIIRDSESNSLLDRVNLVSFVLGVIGALSMMIIANFQETAVITVHLLAACLCFGFGCIYMMLQSWITVMMYPLYTNRRIGIIRSCITAVSTVSFVVAVSFGIYAAHVFHQYYPDLPTPRPWNRKLWQPMAKQLNISRESVQMTVKNELGLRSYRLLSGLILVDQAKQNWKEKCKKLREFFKMRRIEDAL